MSTTYPGTKQTFTDPAGTSFLAGTPAGGANAVDHSVLHTNMNDTVEAVEDTLGTTTGTSVLKHYAAGEFPVRHTGVAATGTLVQTLVGGTIQTPTISTPTIRSWDGWEDANETWTFASATTITVPSDATTKYKVGDKVKLTQTTVKYFYIVGVAATLLTVTGGSDYTVANATITLPYYSHDANPLDFPATFNYTPTFTGWSSDPVTTGYSYKFSISGRLCWALVNQGTNGTSNSTSTSISAPVTCATLAGGDNGVIRFCIGFDNNAAITAYGYILSNTATFIFQKTFGTDASWTASGNKRIDNFSIIYPI